MVLGLVVGTVVASRKEEELKSLKFLLVKPCDAAGKPTSAAPVVAADAVGSGSSARQTVVTKDRPVDATIMAIVDTVDMDGKAHYTKS
jgi:microcompartment protein CcmK/EutM